MENLGKRLFSSAILILLLLMLIFFDNTYLIIGGAVAFVFWSSVEFYDLVQQKGIKASKWYGTISNIVIIIVVGVLCGLNEIALSLLTWVFLFAACGAFVRQLFVASTNNAIFGISATILGIFYIGYLFSFLVLLRFFQSVAIGKYYLLSAVMMIKFSDAFAFFIGSIFGKHRLNARLSPKKSIEGLAGGIIGSVVGGLVTYFFIKEVGFSILDAVVLGCIIGVVAEIGDLSESLLKRDAEIKDSRQLFPGLGGMLDILDSPLLCAPVFYFYVRYILNS